MMYHPYIVVLKAKSSAFCWDLEQAFWDQFPLCLGLIVEDMELSCTCTC